ncbi:MAG TPA: glutamate-1-semialdehyde 2,1-aminomutase [Trueperaceae bacterium]
MPRSHETSRALFERARRLMPGGVSSPVRAFGAVGGSPVFMARGRGSRVYDVDGNEYVDMVGAWGPHLLGHSHPSVVSATREALEDGVAFGTPSPREVRLAELVLDRYSLCERVRFVNSGTEATMSALRLARAVTGRDAFVKLAGNYHGHADPFLVQAGSGALTTGVPSSAGVPEAVARDTLVAPYNDLPALERLLSSRRGEVAAVVLEPVAGNMGVVPPEPGYLEGVRALTREHGALLVVDEVMTGFRLARAGAVERFGLEPDLVTWGKVIGGGFPVGAYGGPAALMDRVSPAGDVYQAGTLSGNPVAMAAGAATLEAIDAEVGFYDRLEEASAALERGLRAGADAAGIAVTVNRVGSMVTVFFTPGPVRDLDGAKRSDLGLFARWFHGLLERGVYWPPSQFEAAFVSAAHTREDIAAVVDAAAASFAALQG